MDETAARWAFLLIVQRTTTESAKEGRRALVRTAAGSRGPFGGIDVGCCGGLVPKRCCTAAGAWARETGVLAVVRSVVDDGWRMGHAVMLVSWRVFGDVNME